VSDIWLIPIAWASGKVGILVIDIVGETRGGRVQYTTLLTTSQADRAHMNRSNFAKDSSYSRMKVRPTENKKNLDLLFSDIFNKTFDSVWGNVR
jgi:hypothetical protein